MCEHVGAGYSYAQTTSLIGNAVHEGYYILWQCHACGRRQLTETFPTAPDQSRIYRNFLPIEGQPLTR